MWVLIIFGSIYAYFPDKQDCIHVRDEWNSHKPTAMASCVREDK